MCQPDVKHKVITKKEPKVFYGAFAIVDEFMLYIEKEDDDNFADYYFAIDADEFYKVIYSFVDALYKITKEE